MVAVRRVTMKPCAVAAKISVISPTNPALFDFLCLFPSPVGLARNARPATPTSVCTLLLLHSLLPHPL